MKKKAVAVYALILIGAGVAMEVFRHKTLHLKFKFGVPFLLFVQIFLVGILLTNPGNVLDKIFR